jgi:methionyl-tRNA synthetase
MIAPAMPSIPEKVWAQIGTDAADNCSWSDAVWGKTKPGQTVKKIASLFPRIENKDENKLADQKEVKENGNKKEAAGMETVVSKDGAKENKVSTEQKDNIVSTEQKDKDAKGTNPDTPAKTGDAPVNQIEQISIEDFAKIDLRVAEVIACEKVEKTEKLLKLQIKLGEETRTIVSGIAKHYSPEEMVGKKVIVVANLKPAKLRGIMSHGMLLAASNEDTLEVLTIEKELPTGSRVK